MHIPTIPACGALVLLVAMLGACGTPTGDEPAVVPPTAPVPQKEALAFYCQYMKDLDLAAFEGVQPQKLQETIAEDMKTKASAGGIAGFDAFWGHVTSMEPADKSGWIDAGIAAHGLDAECIAVKGPGTGGC